MAVDVQDHVEEDVEETVSSEDTALTAPDMASEESIAQFKLDLSMREKQFGVKNLLRLVTRCRRHAVIYDQQYTRIKTAVARLNGDRTPLQQVGDKHRSLRATAKRFYESLSTQGLRMQCTLFNIDYNSYENMEDIITALVDAHINMNM